MSVRLDHLRFQPTEISSGAGSIPLRFQGGVAAPLIKGSRSSAAQTGWLVISNKIRIAARAYKEAARPFTNHPVCAAEERNLLLRRSHPSLKTEGNGAVSQIFIFIRTVQSRKIRCKGRRHENTVGLHIVLSAHLCCRPGNSR